MTKQSNQVKAEIERIVRENFILHPITATNQLYELFIKFRNRRMIVKGGEIK
jgi:hypothetical protein